MTPVTFLDGAVSLYLGDMREIVPTLGRFGACITDPPYGIGAGTGIGKVTKEGSDFRGRKQWDFAPPDKATFDMLRSVTDHQIIWGGNYFELPPSKCFLVWDKVQPEDFSLAMAEQAWTNVDRPAKIFRWKSMSINGGEPKLHPTQKPENLMKWCCAFVPEASAIIDPWMGYRALLARQRSSWVASLPASRLILTISTSPASASRPPPASPIYSSKPQRSPYRPIY